MKMLIAIALAWPWLALADARIEIDDAFVPRLVVCDRPASVEHAIQYERIGRDVLIYDLPWQKLGGNDSALEFVLPAGLSVSAPGSSATGLQYRLAASAPNFTGVVAIGPFDEQRIELPGGVLDVVVLDGDPPADETTVIEWLSDAATHLLSVFGAFPTERLQVVVVPVAGSARFREYARSSARREAVPFGRVLRAGGLGVQFFVDQSASLDRLLADWTATHEFSHLLLPHVRRADAWLSEGFASYYQNVLRARVGAYSEAEAWRKLLEGFDRGRGDNLGRFDDSLSDAIRHRGSNFLMRMYWSGAAIALLADIELRARGSSLDAVLGRLHACCLPSSRSYSARALVDELDRLGGDGTFERLRARWAPAHEFPRVDTVLADLGIARHGTQLQLDDAAPLAAMRRALMSAQNMPTSRPAASVRPSVRQRSSAASETSPTTTIGSCTSTNG